jgi:polyhydroxybutyrate depolymerase
VKVNDTERSYVVHIPPGVDGVHLIPVLFAFHGSGDSPSGMQSLTGFNDLADKSGVVVVYPKSLGVDWNDGPCCSAAATQNVDEAAFVRQILADLETVITVDPKRVYAAGFSNGAGLVFRLGCEMSDTFAAVAPVAGALVFQPCQTQDPVSLINVQGKADPYVPYETGGGELNTPPVEKEIADWAKMDGCTDPAKVEKTTNIITHISYSFCEKGAAVELYAIEPGGHMWPTKFIWPASQTIWDFFLAHPKS